MGPQDELLVFSDEPAAADTARHAAGAWNILIVDDDLEIHTVTRLVLQDVSFEGNRLNFLSAHSGAEARSLLAIWGDRIAIAIIDVVMESQHSGLELVRHIRESCHNQLTRIILRTGQPGQAPERAVITNYDINDYKEKSELTSQKLFSSVVTALRSYRDLATIQRGRQGLEQIIRGSSPLFQLDTGLADFTRLALDQICGLLDDEAGGAAERPARVDALMAVGKPGTHQVVAATGTFGGMVGSALAGLPDEAGRDRLAKAARTQGSSHYPDGYVGYYRSRLGMEALLLARAPREPSDMERHLVDIFGTNLALAFDNLMLNRDITDTQKEILYTIGDVVETRSHETANHVNRVARYSVLLARLAGLGPQDAELIMNASPMHDLGKIGIPDSIMIKPSALTPDEVAVMRTHTVIGWEILNRSNRPILQAAATIALQHHENWDGTGYPNRLAGEDIHVFARITALADVFDALSHRRIYKEAWALPKVKDYIAERAGTQFDPACTRLLLDNWDRFIEIMESLPDRPAQPEA